MAVFGVRNMPRHFNVLLRLFGQRQLSVPIGFLYDRLTSVGSIHVESGRISGPSP